MIKKNIFNLDKFKINNIYNMDCLLLTKHIANNSIDLIFADPPYNLSKKKLELDFINTGGKILNTDKGQWDHFSHNDFEEFNKAWIAESFRILKENGSIWVSGTYHNIYMIGYLLSKIGFEILNEILWYKIDATPNLSCTRFVADHENFIWARKGKKNTFNYLDLKKMNNGKQMRSTWMSPKRLDSNRIHPTQKPEWLLKRIILATSKEKDVVFDPFMGSATTAIVASKLNRFFIGSEKNKEYYELSQKRLKDFYAQNNIR
jgi:site-specific DNA-methyltransferase (adenine-specific)